MPDKRNRQSDPHEGHRERLRQRFQRNGLAGFHDYEVIELLLTLARPRGDTKRAGKGAVCTFGSVRGVLDASPADLSAVAGMGDASVFVIKFARALAEYYYAERMQQNTVSLGNSREVVDYLRVSMASLDRETFVVVYVDAQNRPMAVDELFEGTLTSSVVYPREVFKKALEHRAAAIILAHNHPSGCIEPSPEDRRITSDLVVAAGYMDVDVLDHIIIGANGHFSFADHGLIREYRERARDFHEGRRVI